MSEYQLSIRGNIGLSDFSSISDYVGIVGKDDVLNINMDTNSSTEMELVYEILKKKDFIIDVTQNSKTQECNIIAHKTT